MIEITAKEAFPEVDLHAEEEVEEIQGVIVVAVMMADQENLERVVVFFAKKLGI